jgi:heterotetrameric sarcosine oxidase gamma subunit
VAESSSKITFRELRIGQAWNLRGNARNGAFASGVDRLLATLPVEPLTSTRRDDAAMLWLGPRSWLFVTGASSPERDFDATRIAVNTAGGALFDVSASYVGWTIEGEHAARVLNRECPLDLGEGAFPAGHSAQSTLGHINAMIYRPRDATSFVVMVARSFATDAWHLLQAMAATEGHVVEAAVDFAAA